MAGDIPTALDIIRDFINIYTNIALNAHILYNNLQINGYDCEKLINTTNLYIDMHNNIDNIHIYNSWANSHTILLKHYNY